MRTNIHTQPNKCNPIIMLSYSKSIIGIMFQCDNDDDELENPTVDEIIEMIFPDDDYRTGEYDA